VSSYAVFEVLFGHGVATMSEQLSEHNCIDGEDCIRFQLAADYVLWLLDNEYMSESAADKCRKRIVEDIGETIRRG